MKFSGVVFDLDGTLLDTLADLLNSTNVVLKKHGFPIHEMEEFKYFVGCGVQELAARVLPSESRDEKTVKECLSEIIAEYDKRYCELTKPYDGINQLIDKLEAMGIKMSVLSNKPDNFAKIMVDKYFGLKRFDYVFGDREGFPRKPDPFCALEIAKLTGILPSDYLYLGDTDVDMETANAAGMYAVGAAWGFRPADELLKNGARKVINNPTELLELI